MTNRPINKLARISSDGSKNNFNAINQILNFLAETSVSAVYVQQFQFE